MAKSVDRDANRALRARFEDVYGHYQRLRTGIDDIQNKLTIMRATAESADRLIRVSVDSRGTLAELKIDARAYRDLHPDELSRSIVETTRRACAHATQEVQELMASYLPDDSGAMRFLRDNDLGSFLHRQDEIMKEARRDG